MASVSSRRERMSISRVIVTAMTGHGHGQKE